MKRYTGSFLVLLVVAIANYIGQEYGVAMKVPNYDVYLHFFGGVGIGLAGSALLGSIVPGYFSSGKGKWLVWVGVLAVGLIWETFEAYFDIAGAHVGTYAYYLDTVKDLMNDLIGGAVSIWIASRFSSGRGRREGW